MSGYGPLDLCCKLTVATQDDPIDNGKKLLCNGCRRWLQFSKMTGWYLRKEQPSTTQASDDDECAFVHVLPSGNVRCGALRRHHSQYTGHQFTEPRTDRKHCNQSMRYDVISNGDIFDGQRLVGTYYCERCSTMQPVYEAVNNNEPPAPRAGERERWQVLQTALGESRSVFDSQKRLIANVISGDLAHQIATEHNQHATLVAQREQLLVAVRKFVNYYDGPNAARLGNGQARRSLDEFRQLLVTIEQEGEA